MNLKSMSTKLSVKPQQLLLPKKNGTTFSAAYVYLEINGNDDDECFLKLSSPFFYVTRNTNLKFQNYSKIRFIFKSFSDTLFKMFARFFY